MQIFQLTVAVKKSQKVDRCEAMQDLCYRYCDRPTHSTLLHLT
ncbi:hypothetical protein SLEP1_g13389 [Rubroshorea leprosula]|uniref:Uncharacterized protein n=1 Tax=Rubroshorea leprosula TaxID=152421 RepID=A0AAV5IFQ2_9ROSI|nr:hypothetical protein SLEP1_g13389 [Rubroshorea leprosula]